MVLLVVSCLPLNLEVAGVEGRCALDCGELAAVADAGEVGRLDGAVVAEAAEEAGAEANDVLATGEVGDGGGAYYCCVVAWLGVRSFEAESVFVFTVSVLIH
jgi:hypothetical protein